MAGKFIDLSEAAKMVGVTPEQLVEMRSKGDIFGYRDGASWKFKLEEVQRVVSERGVGSGTGSGILNAGEEEFDNLLSGLSSKVLADKAQEEAESILVSEEALGVSSGGPSTIIGKGKKAAGPAEDSDIKLADEGGSSKVSTGSDKLLEAPGSKLNLGADPSDVLGGSDLKIATGSGTGEMPAVKAKGGSTGDGLDLGEGLSLHADDDLELGSDDALDGEIALDKPGSGTRPGGPGGSGIGSDITLGAGDSGINLAPTDSGLSLDEEPLDLGGSQVESLELPEDDEVISLESESADPDQATQLKADNDFMLSPGDSLGEDESDSGSQVIALEDSEGFDQDAATMLRSEPGGALAPDAFQPMPGSDASLPGMGGGVGPAQPVYVQIPVVEAPYSIWNVLSLMLITVMLMLTGMLMVDVMLNMWSFSGTSSVSTGLMDTFIKTFGLEG
ncbi:MAG: helix-turn-helix domain-containing protein [Pirellulaceae bacterium]|nr:helix-turn-helix domain-containing protein [Pirellulaceae bacterium]